MLDGRLTIVAGEQRFELDSGGAAVVPMGVAHTFRVDSETARVLVLSTPAGLERLCAMARSRATSPTLPPPTRRARRRSGWSEIFSAHGQANLGPPLGRDQ